MKSIKNTLTYAVEKQVIKLVDKLNAYLQSSIITSTDNTLNVEKQTSGIYNLTAGATINAQSQAIATLTSAVSTLQSQLALKANSADVNTKAEITALLRNYVTESDLGRQLQSYATNAFVTQQDATLNTKINAKIDRTTADGLYAQIPNVYSKTDIDTKLNDYRLKINSYDIITTDALLANKADNTQLAADVQTLNQSIAATTAQIGTQAAQTLQAANTYTNEQIALITPHTQYKGICEFVGTNAPTTYTLEAEEGDLFLQYAENDPTENWFRYTSGEWTAIDNPIPVTDRQEGDTMFVTDYVDSGYGGQLVWQSAGYWYMIYDKMLQPDGTTITFNSSGQIQANYGTEVTRLDGRIDTTNGNVTANTTAIGTNTTAIGNNTTAIGTINTALEGKANTGDSYTKSEADELYNDYLPVTTYNEDKPTFALDSEVYTQSVIDEKLSAKQDKLSGTGFVTMANNEIVFDNKVYATTGALAYKQDALNGTGLVRSTAGTISYDTTQYLDNSDLTGYATETYVNNLLGDNLTTLNNLVYGT